MSGLIRFVGLVFWAFCMMPHAAMAKQISVVVSIKPLHSLVMGVMKGDGNPPPILLVEGNVSPHSYTLKPSQVSALISADLVFMLGKSFEMFLHETLSEIAVNTQVVELSRAEGIRLLALREGGDFDRHAHDHDHEHGHEEAGAMDLHVWLDPVNAKLIVRKIAAELNMVNPDEASLYQRNAEALEDRLDMLHASLKVRLAPFQTKRFMVFHDAYHYFERSYGLKAVGTIMLKSGVEPGAKHLSSIRAKIAEKNVQCVFSEPQFDNQLITMLIEGTATKTVALDPEGALFDAGEDHYFQLMEGLAKSFEQCLRVP